LTVVMCRRPPSLRDSEAVTARPPTIASLLVTAVVVLAAANCGGDDDGGAAVQLSGAAEEGRQIARNSGCSACHGADGQGGIGPGWAGDLGKQVELTDGSTVTVDEAYLKRSIADPSAQVHAGFNVSMPENELTEEEIDKVVTYIVSLNGGTAPGTTG
jgi:mono/diheme cytochrome c family protein